VAVLNVQDKNKLVTIQFQKDKNQCFDLSKHYFDTALKKEKNEHKNTRKRN
jgi:hypothetical protein